jgi:hypothetical protein
MMQEIRLSNYLSHLPFCNIRTDWSEAEVALSESPEGPDKEMAYREIGILKQTCTCGLKELKDVIEDPSVKGLLAEFDIK